MGIDIEQTLMELATTCGKIKQSQDDMHGRLFVDGGGLLPTMLTKVSGLEKELGTRAAVADIVRIDKEVALKAAAKDVADLKDKRVYSMGFAAGAGTVGGFIVKWAASKFGLHF